MGELIGYEITLGEELPSRLTKTIKLDGLTTLEIVSDRRILSVKKHIREAEVVYP